MLALSHRRKSSLDVELNALKGADCGDGGNDGGGGNGDDGRVGDFV